jgi:glyoxylate reductase
MSVVRPTFFVAVPLPDPLMAKIAERFDVAVAPSGFFPSRQELCDLAPKAAAVATTVMCRFDAELLELCPHLRVISACGIGLDHIDVAAASRRGIAVCNTPGLQNETVAELTLALLFALARNVLQNDAFVRSGAWTKGHAPLAMDIRGKRLGLLGLGGIGLAVARAATALGMKTVYHKRNRDSDAESRGIAAYVARDELFQTADFVSLHLPLTAGTRASIGARELALMKPGSFLINTARGAIIDEAALINALTTGPLAGAGLDVMVEEPLPADSPLCRLPNVVLAPHAGGATRETRERMECLCVENALAVLSGTLPLATANRAALAQSTGAPLGAVPRG